MLNICAVCWTRDGNTMLKLRSLLILVLGLALGCSAPVAPEDTPKERPTPPVAGKDFDLARCGSIQGRVTWNGEVPREPDLFLRPLLTDPAAMPRSRPFPLMPLVDPKSHGLAH